MDDNGKRILEMLSEGKISVDEAERLLSLVDSPAVPEPLEVGSRPRRRNGPGKYLRIVGVEGDDRVDIRVPLSLIRGGVKLGGLFASGPGGKWGERLKERGIDLAQLDGDSGLDDLIEGLAELEMDFQDGGERVVIYTE